MIDVLIIGAGPHALTLATLLSNPCLDTKPGQDPSLLNLCLDSLKLTNNKRHNSKMKGRLTTAVRLHPTPNESVPSEGEICPPLTLRVVDSYGQWAALWESQFVALNIPHLRSHTLVHTDPFNKKALQDFVLQSSRSSELHSLPDQVYILDENAFFNDMRLGKKERKRLSTSTLKKSLSFSLPGTNLSVDFFKHQVGHWCEFSALTNGHYKVC